MIYDKSKEKVCKDTGGFGISLQDGVVRCATANAPQLKAANPFNCGFDVTVYYSPGSASGGGARGSALVYNYDRSVPDQFQAISSGVRVGYDCDVTFF
jgi:hypothetical protein